MSRINGTDRQSLAQQSTAMTAFNIYLVASMYCTNIVIALRLSNHFDFDSSLFLHQIQSIQSTHQLRGSLNLMKKLKYQYLSHCYWALLLLLGAQYIDVSIVFNSCPNLRLKRIQRCLIKYFFSILLKIRILFKTWAQILDEVLDWENKQKQLLVSASPRPGTGRTVSAQDTQLSEGIQDIRVKTSKAILTAI